MENFADGLLRAVAEGGGHAFAWCVLPNHYHVLVEVSALADLVGALGRLHGRSACAWNREEGTRGRKVFFRAADRAMRSERHFLATLNYVHHNPIRHGYVERWTDWPWSSASEYLSRVGWAEAERRWREYPIGDYGRGWDRADL
ncbi:MAG: transposase [Verrucomicrobiae bacterium]|nr:transposase [Verrucomicrobiae bacterium]